jgi:hypothetical protein
MGIVQQPIDQAMTAMVRDLPNKKEVYQKNSEIKYKPALRTLPESA